MFVAKLGRAALSKTYQDVAVRWRKQGRCGVRRRYSRADWSGEFRSSVPPTARPRRWPLHQRVSGTPGGCANRLDCLDIRAYPAVCYQPVTLALGSARIE